MNDKPQTTITEGCVANIKVRIMKRDGDYWRVQIIADIINDVAFGTEMMIHHNQLTNIRKDI